MENLKTVKKDNQTGRPPLSLKKNKAGLAALIGSASAAGLSPLMTFSASSDPGSDPGPAPERSPKQIRQRFYYLHEQLKKRYKVDVKSKTIYVDDFEKIPVPYSEYVEELRASGYSIQKSMTAIVPDVTIGKQKIKQIARLYAGSILQEITVEASSVENLSEGDLVRVVYELRAIGKDLVESVTATPLEEKNLQAAINHVLNIKF